MDLSAWAPSAPIATPDPPNIAAIVRKVDEDEEGDEEDDGVMVTEIIGTSNRVQDDDLKLIRISCLSDISTSEASGKTRQSESTAPAVNHRDR